jgi:putative RNA 2'-phosphotransferase
MAISDIRKEGLRPMGRQYVHLSSDEETAVSVGKRKTNTPVILRVRAGRASQDGVAFYIGNEKVWLADRVPPEYLIWDGLSDGD